MALRITASYADWPKDDDVQHAPIWDGLQRLIDSGLTEVQVRRLLTIKAYHRHHARHMPAALLRDVR